jgi:peptidoglycan/LPS O-acetylase OafA/YrhL
MADDSAEQRSGYLPGLDGIRAIAVGSVVAYHLGVPHFDGGLLGVSVFFTLSGYLITSLLVRGYEERGRVDLKNFWIRRARRLLPALVLMLPVVVVTTAIARPDKLVATGRQALYALMYVANWTTISNGDDYFQRFASPGPLDHLWSLAIEEQFYIVWPLLVLALLAIGKKLGKAQRVPLAFVTVAFTLASTWAISHLYDPHGLNNTRAYEGTDARAASLLIGALFALALPFDKVGTITSRASRVVLDVFGLFGLAGIALIIAKTDEYSPFLYTGGEISLSLCTAMAAMAASHPQGLLARALGILPLRWVGARSYGVYLWHMPVCAFMPASVLIDKPIYRGLVQVGLIFVLAAASFRLIEDPIRRRVQAPKPGRRRLAFSAAGFVPLAIVSLVVWPLSCRPASSPELEAVIQDPDPQPVSTTMVESAIPAPTTTALAAITLTPDMLATSCKEVAHVGDSTSLGLVSKVLLPNESDQIPARYRGVGVERFFSEISGARSMVEKYKDQPNATEIVKRRHESGYKGCYVMALGTNDPANTSGNQQMLSQRIDTMMAQIGDVPALWTTTKTLKDKGPYQNSHMASWNETLVKACARHPNMRVYDWASEVQDAWFTPDGIHFNTPGYKERAIRLSKALAHAFPREGAPPADCVVHAAD